jgi:hypothetical protein
MGKERKVYIGRHHSEDQGIDGRRGSKWIVGRLAGVEGCVEWIHSAQDREKWQALANTMINLRVLEPQSYLTPNMQYELNNCKG